MSTILFLGFNSAEILKLLHQPQIKKVVIFDNSYENRENFENLYRQHTSDCKNSTYLTMYEGCISRNIDAFLQKKEIDDDKYIYYGDIQLLSSCKNTNQNEVHYSCSNRDSDNYEQL